MVFRGVHLHPQNDAAIKKKKKAGKPEDAGTGQHPLPTSVGTRLPAHSGSVNYSPGSARGVPEEGTAIWGCPPPTALTQTPSTLCHAERLLVTNHPCRLRRAGLLGPTAGAGEGRGCRRVTGTDRHHIQKMIAQPGLLQGHPLSSPPSL